METILASEGYTIKAFKFVECQSKRCNERPAIGADVVITTSTHLIAMGTFNKAGEVTFATDHIRANLSRYEPAYNIYVNRQHVGLARELAVLHNQLIEEQDRREEEQAEERRQQAEEQYRQEEERRQVVQKALQVASQQEIDAGRCTDQRGAVMENRLFTIRDVFRTSRGPHFFESDIVVVDDEAEFEFRAPMGGTYHIMVASFSPVALEITDTTGRKLLNRSNYLWGVGSVGFEYFDGLVVQPNRGDAHHVLIKGHGCTLLMNFYAP